jgi:hypothetical protein
MKEMIKYEKPKLINFSEENRPTSEGISTAGACNVGNTADYTGAYQAGYYWNCLGGGTALG